MTYEDIVFDYNNRALDDRTWDMISDRERVEFVLRVRGRQEPVAWSRLDTAKSVITENEDIKRGWDLDGLPFKCLFDSPHSCPECDEKQSAIDVWEGRYADKTAECEKLKAKIDLTNTLAQQSNQDHLNVRKDYQGEIIKLKAERDELKNDLADMLDAKNGIGPTALSTVISQRDELAAQVMHWKANHASVVEQARILKERPDMPIERVKAYESWVAMAAQVEKMREVLEDIQKCEFAARVEGLVECLAAIDDEHRPAGRLKDLVERRLLYMARYADEALALPDLSAGILNRVRADALRKAVTLCEKHERWVQTGMGKQFKSWDAATVMAGTLASAIRTLAADMEAGKC